MSPRSCFLARAAWRISALLLIAGLSGCSILYDKFGSMGGFLSAAKPKPVDLPANVALLGVRAVWSARIGEVSFPLDAVVNGNMVTVAASDGTVVAIDATSGRDLWRGNAGAAIAAGVGSDGKLAAVVTRANEVVVLEGGKVLWKQKLTAQSNSAPFVAGARVFVLTADRTVTAFDGQTGVKLWSIPRPAEPLVLRQAGVMLAVGDTLLVGLGGRLVGINPQNGTVRWEAPIASPRGTNDVERLVDLVAPVSRVGNVVCARAFQASVGCVSADAGRVLWTKPASGGVGVHGDATLVFGTESDGRLSAWRRSDGERAWTTDRLLYRSLSAPLSIGRSVVVGDGDGLLHLLSREDGSALNRLTTDGSAIAAAPLLAGNTLVAVTRNGGVFGFVPE